MTPGGDCHPEFHLLHLKHEEMGLEQHFPKHILEASTTLAPSPSTQPPWPEQCCQCQPSTHPPRSTSISWLSGSGPGLHGLAPQRAVTGLTQALLEKEVLNWHPSQLCKEGT